MTGSIQTMVICLDQSLQRSFGREPRSRTRQKKYFFFNFFLSLVIAGERAESIKTILVVVIIIIIITIINRSIGNEHNQMILWMNHTVMDPLHCFVLTCAEQRFFWPDDGKMLLMDTCYLMNETLTYLNVISLLVASNVFDPLDWQAHFKWNIQRKQQNLSIMLPPLVESVRLT